MPPRSPARAHLLGIDDGPFEKFRDGESTPIVGVMMEGADLVESVAVTWFPIDAPDVSDFLVEWIESLRIRPGLQGIVLGGITIAGLAVVDMAAIAERLALPVIVVNRRSPSNERLRGALRAAGFAARVALLERAPEPFRIGPRLHAAVAGASPEHAAALLRGCLRKSELPEPLRLAHLIARAVVKGESRGRP
ncbi:MAG: DUF99 family protein [Myxococcales bacterium]|nr:DUF99 family protein [Myxococcales bacterium]MDH5565090.1 DUF99 family protein [Myxococcales bacterium]